MNNHLLNTLGRIALLITFNLSLVACGGGGGGSSDGGSVSFTVSTSASANGAISPTSTSVNENSSTHFTLTPEVGFSIEAASGCGGTLAGNTYTTGPITADCTVTVSFLERTLDTVSALFSNAANWNDYAKGASWATATNTACDASLDSACIHGGEVRVVQVTGKTSCDGLTAEDDLAAFNWVCDATGGAARMISTGLAYGKYLSELIDFGAVGFISNAVTVYEYGIVWGTTPTSVWWNNPVQVNNDGGNLATASTIYLVTSDAAADYTIINNKIALVIASDITLSGAGSGGYVISTNTRDYIWLEGGINAVGDSSGVSFYKVNYSVLRNLSVFNAVNTGIITSSGRNITLTDVTSSNNGDDGIGLATVNSKLFNVTANNNGNDGFFLSGNLDPANLNNTLLVVSANNNVNNGFEFYYASHNRLAGVTASNNGNSGNGAGVVLGPAATNNILMDVTANNNFTGIYVQAKDNLLAGLSVANNGPSGVTNAGDANNNTFADVVVANNVAYGITIFTPGRFTGLLEVGNNGFDATYNCFAGGPDMGLEDDTCSTNGASDADLTTGITLANSFVGKVNSDSQNVSDVSGAAENYPVSPGLFDWTHFDNNLRSWGLDGSAFPANNQQGRWSTGPGRIWDWSVSSGDTGNAGGPALRGVLAVPTGNDTFTSTWGIGNDSADCEAMVAGSIYNNGLCETTFLRYAVELPEDGIGNDNTLCESGESCLYTPNIGSYQGHGNLVSAGTFTAGTLAGITLMKYGTNGY